MVSVFVLNVVLYLIVVYKFDLFCSVYCRGWGSVFDYVCILGDFLGEIGLFEEVVLVIFNRDGKVFSGRDL